MDAKRKPIPGHKRGRVSHGISVTCECGWTSNTYFGKGASREAHSEHRMHAEKHAPKEVEG